MKIIWLLLLIAIPAMADTTLKCKLSKGYLAPANVSSYDVVQTGEGKKAQYKLIVHLKNDPKKTATYAFVSAGSGDEDEYNVKASGEKKKEIGVQAAYIQEDFNWTQLVNYDGSQFADCR